MQPKIKIGKPPNFMAIVKEFPKAHSASTLFAYDNTIYVSSAEVLLSRALIRHESVHIDRQNEIGVDNWWSLYLSDKEFRYDEELRAHRAEYQELVRGELDKKVRGARLSKVAKRLTLPLYKFNVSLEKAKEDILNTLNI